jgi:hypothetical protein
MHKSVILPLVLHGHELRLRVFEGRVLRRLSGSLRKLEKGAQ